MDAPFSAMMPQMHEVTVHARSVAQVFWPLATSATLARVIVQWRRCTDAPCTTYSAQCSNVQFWKLPAYSLPAQMITPPAKACHLL